MVYADTSALVPMFILEPRSEALLAWMESTDERLLVSEWGVAEFASATAIKVRTGEITPAIARQARTRLLGFAQAHCAIAVPQRAEFRRAAELSASEDSKLRAGDALHLAIAEAGNAGGILCFDQAMSRAAAAMGMKVISP